MVYGDNVVGNYVVDGFIPGFVKFSRTFMNCHKISLSHKFQLCRSEERASFFAFLFSNKVYINISVPSRPKLGSFIMLSA